MFGSRNFEGKCKGKKYGGKVEEEKNRRSRKIEVNVTLFLFANPNQFYLF